MPLLPHRLDGLRLRHLRLLELIDEHRSLRAVGAILNRTQPAVSQMVKDLEYAFGATLVQRSVRGVTLSPAGKLALQRARSGLASLDHLVAELGADQSPILRVGTNPALVFRMWPTAMRLLETGTDRVRMRLRTGIVGDMLQSLWDGELDCYVGRVDWDQMPPEMVRVLRHDPLIQTDLVLACSLSHPLAGRKDIAIRELADWQWVLPPADSNNRIALEAEFRNHGVLVPAPMMEISADLAGMMILARELELLTCIPRSVLDSHIAAGQLCALDVPALTFPPIQIGFMTLAEHEDMASVQILRRVLTAAAQEMNTPPAPSAAD
ncbi:LysR substrate-binding domain-containing protein [Jiella pacifica]|uniref:LysR family transcriptional regulator n=1 Tax=Jiella pacifica TaxID=2696469 RepID=A0A6N9T9W5_9HYPH|nr:LysR substrate-binding domain-containing protein [Jiella pacifica]NDW07342.1 LysR family transcriptional regulator [Jiella pacifica]